MTTAVEDLMSSPPVTCPADASLTEATSLMDRGRIGSVVVTDGSTVLGILTERDILDSVAAGEDPEAELAGEHRTEDLTFASPDWTLEQAAAAMIKGGFRHLVVLEGHDVAGLLSMRDIVRCWTGAEVPASAGPRAVTTQA